MTTDGMNPSQGNSPAANAGVFLGDAVWLRAVRNSPVSLTPLYRRTLDRVQSHRLARQLESMTA